MGIFAGPEMKIATFNINDVNKRHLLGWLRRARPDVAWLQELKAADAEFPIKAIKKAGYGAVWLGVMSPVGNRLGKCVMGVDRSASIGRIRNQRPNQSFQDAERSPS